MQALVFDVFGTCVDWRGSVIRELRAAGEHLGVEVDWQAFADEWRRDGYIAPIRAILAGEEPYVDSDALFERKLRALLSHYGISGLVERDVRELSGAWRRLDPWPDSVAGLQRLKRGFTISPLS